MRETLVRLLQDYNWSKVERPIVKPCAVEMRDPKNDAIIGGLWGVSAGGWFLVETLIVPEGLRQRGLGTSLVHTAEKVAADRGCHGIWLDTHTFQAPTFYEKLGYKIMGRLPDFPKGHDRIFYFKMLDATPDSSS